MPNDEPRAAAARADWDEGRAEELRCAVWLYETYQAERVRIGEQLRAMLQGRDPRWAATRASGPRATSTPDAAATLRAILRGAVAGPAPALAEAYRRYGERERESLAVVRTLVARHPAWPWIAEVRGVGATLAAELLARLDVRRAPTASSFWAYCGLGTDAGPAGAARTAQRRAPVHGHAPFDRRARAVCHLLGVSVMRRGGAYKAYYREQRALLAAERAGWSRQRQHLTALRKVEKRFLAHLWVVWRRAAGLPADAAGAEARAIAPVDPWAMVG
jgi:hypothetical protein